MLIADGPATPLWTMRRKYRIAYLLTPIEFGGLEKVSLDFLRHIDRERFDIRPIVFFRPWEGDTFFLKETRKAGFCPRTIPVSLGKHDRLWLIRRFSKLLSLLRGNHFDLLHTHGYAADILGISSARLLRIPTISTCHGFIENDRKVSLYNRLDRFFLRFADEIIAVSEDIGRLLATAGINPRIIKVIPNAVALKKDDASLQKDKSLIRDRLGFSEKDVVFGYVGRLSKEKGLLYLIEALSLARRAGCPARLLIIGEGIQKEELCTAAKDEGLGNAVVFAGFQSDLGRFFPAMDAFVLPSLTEGTPIALLEAMANGIPSIASAVGQIPDIIETGKTGILVSPRRAKEICEAMLTLYTNPSLREAMGQAGRKIVEAHFDIRTWVKRIEGEYIQLILTQRRF